MRMVKMQTQIPRVLMWLVHVSKLTLKPTRGLSAKWHLDLYINNVNKQNIQLLLKKTRHFLPILVICFGIFLGVWYICISKLL